MEDIRLVIEIDPTVPNRLTYLVIDHHAVPERTILSQIRSINHVTNLSVAPGQVIVEVTSVTDIIVADIRNRLIDCLAGGSGSKLVVESVKYKEGGISYESVLAFEGGSVRNATRKETLINSLFRPVHRVHR
jgi:hypothetical protein